MNFITLFESRCSHHACTSMYGTTPLTSPPGHAVSISPPELTPSILNFRFSRFLILATPALLALYISDLELIILGSARYVWYCDMVLGPGPISGFGFLANCHV